MSSIHSYLKNYQNDTSCLRKSTLQNYEKIIEGQDDMQHNKQHKLKGIAVKLSVLEKWSIDISTLLKINQTKIIVDAEDKRLDFWLIDQLRQDFIKKNQISDLIITVQVKREDSYDQLVQLEKLGVSVVLVSGHPSYLTDKERSRKSIGLFVNYLNRFDNICLLGITKRIKQKIEKILGKTISSDQVLELYGHQKINESNIWAYFSGNELSMDALSYLKRRGEFNTVNQRRYLVKDLDQLDDLSKSHQVFLYLDIKCRAQYLAEFYLFNKFSKSD